MGPALALAGALLTLLSAAGVVRFSDVLARMHALTKASTLGLVLVLLGGAVTLDHPNDVTSLLLAAALQVLTLPVGANLLARATYRGHGIRHEVDTVDELAEHEGRAPAAGRPDVV
jgi:multicomponent Na+:H+ antiporter subunit G